MQCRIILGSARPTRFWKPSRSHGTAIMIPSTSYSVVGRSVPRLDGLDKIRGTTKYGIDYTLPGMLHARVLRSEHAHARITSIDATRAEELPGVEAVVTAVDAPDVLIG